MPYEIYDQIALAREAAEDAEVELFDPAIEYANDRWTGKRSSIRDILYRTANNAYVFFRCL